MKDCAYQLKFTIGYATDLMGLCMALMESDPEMRSQLGADCKYLGEMVARCARRMASMANGEGATASQDEIQAAAAQLSMIPAEHRDVIAEATVLARKLGFQPGEILSTATKITGEQDPGQLHIKLLQLGDELISRREESAQHAPVVKVAGELTSLTKPDEVAGALLAMGRDLSARKAQDPIVETAKALTKKAEPGEVVTGLAQIESERTRLQGELLSRDYESAIKSGVDAHKIVGAGEEEWVRKNLLTPAAVLSYLTAKTPSHIATEHQEASAEQLAAAHKEKQEPQTITLSLEEEQALFASSGALTHSEAMARRQQFIQNKAQRIKAQGPAQGVK